VRAGALELAITDLVTHFWYSVRKGPVSGSPVLVVQFDQHSSR
jgi:hypothetical protein